MKPCYLDSSKLIQCLTNQTHLVPYLVQFGSVSNDIKVLGIQTHEIIIQHNTNEII